MSRLGGASSSSFMEPRYKVRILLLVLTILLPLAASCSDEPAEIPNDCLRTAEEAGVPSVVLRYMERPSEEWGSLERLAIRDTLEDYDLSSICPDVALAIEHGPASPSPLPAASPEPTPTAETAGPVPPQIPYPSPIAQTAPLPPPTPVSVDEIVEAGPTRSGRISGVPEVVTVTHYGETSNSRGRYVVVFDEPVFTDIPPGARNTSIASSSGMKLPVTYSSSGDTRYLRLITPATIDNPRLTLEFGPVREEFAIARELSLNDGTAIRGLDGQEARLDFPYPVVFVNPGYGDELADSSLVNCLAFLELEGISPLIRRNLRDLRLEELTDAERIEWGDVLRKEIASDWDDLLRLPCADLWTEETTLENASKRNHEWGCGIADDYPLSEIALSQPYDSLSPMDRLTLQFIVSHQGDSWACRQHYPQLYYDRWIPMGRE